MTYTRESFKECSLEDMETIMEGVLDRIVALTLESRTQTDTNLQFDALLQASQYVNLLRDALKKCS